MRLLVCSLRKLSSAFFALVFIGTVLFVAIIKIHSNNNDQFLTKLKPVTKSHSEQVIERRALKRARLCSEIPPDAKDPKWDTVKLWDYLHYNAPHFLNNFKNPCYLTNTTGQPAAPILMRGALRLQCLPYFLIAGFPKSGTTDLWSRLMSHPDIKLRQPKEPNFFNLVRLKPQRFDRAIARYAAFFDKATDELQRLVSPSDCQDKPFPYHHGITGEGSVDVVFDNKKWTRYPGNEFCKEPVITSADYVHQMNPNIKVIFMLRNPTERLFSDYIYEARFIKYQVGLQLFHDAVTEMIKKHRDCWKEHSIRACAYNDTIEDFKIRLRVGMYHIFISDWIELFTKENVLVLNADDTVGEKRSETYRKIFKFLNIRPFTKFEESGIFNRPYVNQRRPAEAKIGDMLPETREIINEFYEPFNKKLAELYPEIDFNKIREPKNDNGQR